MLSKILSGAAGAAVPHWNWPVAGTVGSANMEVAARTDTNGQPDPSAGLRQAEVQQLAQRRAQEARQAGYREGEAAGRSAAQAQLQSALERLAQSLAEITALRPQLMRAAEADLVELSLGIARRILRRELSVDPGALEGLVKAALGKLAAQEICRIRTHPELENGMRQALALAGRGGLSLIADETLERGAVLLETGRGKLDASLETQLAEIGHGLADRVRGK